MSLQETLDALTLILSNDAAFDKVVELVFANLDQNRDGILDLPELESFVTLCCSSMGIKDPPNREQVRHVFKHLDLNNDLGVSRDELEVFLKHLFKEQLKHTQEKLRAQRG